VSRFRYALDPLCLEACVAYLVGRFWLRARFPDTFWDYHFTDLLLIPAALPLLLWVQRRLGLRIHDARPSWAEIGLHLAVWSVAAELIAPHLVYSATGDWGDVLAYSAGAVAAGAWWSRP
jgi:hypothetical protein